MFRPSNLSFSYFIIQYVFIQIAKLFLETNHIYFTIISTIRNCNVRARASDCNCVCRKTLFYWPNLYLMCMICSSLFSLWFFLKNISATNIWCCCCANPLPFQSFKSDKILVSPDQFKQQHLRSFQVWQSNVKHQFCIFHLVFLFPFVLFRLVCSWNVPNSYSKWVSKWVVNHSVFSPE